MQKKIIDLLKKKQGYVSGDQISQRLGITRQGLWKHIQELKEIGYDIVAVPHLGYQLISSPDRLFDFEVSRNLSTKFIGRKIYYFDSLASTMTPAMELGIEGAPEGALVIAEAQEKGRGRLGRAWVSPKYKGIYLSLILRPRVLPVQTTIFTLLAAVSICEAVRKISGLSPRIKWPNDILIEGRKLGGILTELNAETDKVNFIILGIGLNVNNDKKSLIEGAVSLKEQAGVCFDRTALLQEILRKIEENYLLFQKEDAPSIVEKWRRHALTLGRRVKVSSRRGEIEGEAFDIDTDGGLLIRRDSGTTEKVMAGDVVHCR